MTFSELILSTRGRLWDIRSRDGSIITNASVDGIRYTASEMINICKGAILEMLRTFDALDISRLVDSATVNRKKDVVIQKDTGEIHDLDNIEFTKIVALRGANPKDIYEYSKTEQFYARYYDTETFSNSAQIEERVYTILWNETEKKKLIVTLPKFSTDIQGAQVIYRLPYTEIMTLTSTENLPIYDAEDLIWDFAEREARRRENSPQTVIQELTATINNKLMELKVGVQRTS